MVLLYGGNGQGKSNLLEAIYLLAVGKSVRASTDRELVRWQAFGDDSHAQVAAVVQRDGTPLRVQIDYQGEPGGRAGGAPTNEPDATSVQKYVKVNGVPRRVSALVGEVNAVMFSAQDLDLVLGSPSVRRRYLDILISQLDLRYLRALQRYQRIVPRRNHLLKAIRDGRSQPAELDFWDDELVEAGGYVTACRSETVQQVSERAGPIHRDLAGVAELLELHYDAGVQGAPRGASAQGFADHFLGVLKQNRAREVGVGFTESGPHRDDVRTLLDGRDAALYASRGQCRTLVLSMKLTEADHLRDRRGQEPILLLDDALSELDVERRSHILDRVSLYQQCFISTADLATIDDRVLPRMATLAVSGGRVEPVDLGNWPAAAR